MTLGDDVIRMQQEAAQRVQRMQERARRLVAESPPMEVPDAGQSRQTEKRTAAAVEEARHAQSNHPLTNREAKPAMNTPAKGSASGSSALASLVGDQDRLFLLMLAVLLVRNGAKMDLVVALLYLAM